MAWKIIRVLIAVALIVVVLHPRTPPGWRMVVGVALGVGVFTLLAKAFADRW
jgi:RsiW-degrading membrane proteinase PrsW (M82 family)